jgi:hypothetical protein
LSPVDDVASAVENALAAYSGTTAAPHEYFDHTGMALLAGPVLEDLLKPPIQLAHSQTHFWYLQ